MDLPQKKTWHQSTEVPAVCVDLWLRAECSEAKEPFPLAKASDTHINGKGNWFGGCEWNCLLGPSPRGSAHEVAPHVPYMLELPLSLHTGSLFRGIVEMVVLPSR